MLQCLAKWSIPKPKPNTVKSSDCVTNVAVRPTGLMITQGHVVFAKIMVYGYLRLQIAPPNMTSNKTQPGMCSVACL